MSCPRLDCISIYDIAKLKGMLRERAAKYETVATIVDIARICKVSTASVSRAMTGMRGVKAEKREQILSTAKTIGYRPNRAARRLVTNKSHLFGFIASDLQNTAYLEYFHTLERAVRRAGYEFLIADSERSLERESANIEKMLDNRVDGLMLLPVSDWLGEGDVSHLRKLESQPIPVVLFGHLKQVKFDSISADEEAGALLLIDHLFTLGHRSFLYVGIGDSLNRPARERLNGLKRGLAKKGLAASALQTISFEPKGWPKILTRLKSRVPPTAIICVHDLLAFQLYRPLRDAGISVPEDVSLCSFGTSRIAYTNIGELLIPSLTTVEFDNQAVAKGGAAMLLDRLTHPSRLPRTARVPGHLLVRESTGPAK